MLAGERRRERRRLSSAERIWKLCIAGQSIWAIITSIQLQESETRRKSPENRTSCHFSGLGTGSCSSFPPFHNKKKRGNKKKNEAGLILITELRPYVYLQENSWHFYRIFLIIHNCNKNLTLTFRWLM